MQDRISTYPGRVTLVPVSGEENTYTMARADDPTQVGTPLNTENLLSESAVSAINAATGATPETPSEAFRVLAGAASNSPFIWRGIELIPINVELSSYQTIPKYTWTKTVNLPVELDFTKYDYELRVTLFGSKCVRSEGAQSAILTFATYLGTSADSEATEICSLEETAKATTAGHITFPTTMQWMGLVVGDNNKMMTQTEGYENGSYQQANNWSLSGYSPSGKYTKVTARYSNPYDCDTYGMLFEYRVIAERSTT